MKRGNVWFARKFFIVKETITGCAKIAVSKTIGRGFDMTGQWTPQIVEGRIKEAVETSRLLPGVRPIGYRNCWPETSATKAEIWGEQVEGDDLKEKHNNERTKVCATNPAIDRFDEVQRWMTYINWEEKRIVWSFALGASERWIAGRLRWKHGNKKVKRHRIAAYSRICEGLNNPRKQPSNVRFSITYPIY